jgi:GTP-binding protein YchF
VRCFENDDIIHSMGKVDPIRDIEVINTELILADLQSVEQQLDKNQKKARGQDKDAQACVTLLTRLLAHLNEGKPSASLPMSDDERPLLRSFALLSSKSVLYACNVAESHLANPDANPHVQSVRRYVADHHGCESVVICAQVEAELCELPPAESAEFLASLGVTDSGVSALIRGTDQLLGLATYFTAGEKEVRAWTFRQGMTAPQCAGVIHTDFEKGFIKAEVVAYTDLSSLGSVAAARDAGKYRLEGKEYLFQDGDVALFRFAN